MEEQVTIIMTMTDPDLGAAIFECPWFVLTSVEKKETSLYQNKIFLCYRMLFQQIVSH